MMEKKPADERRAFECVCGYALGEIYRDGRITRLRVYRFAISPNELFSLDIETTRMAYVMDGVNDGAVICSHCGAEAPWLANQSAFEDMLRRRNLRRKNMLEVG